MILNHHAHWDTKNNTSFASIPFPIANEINQKLSMLVQSEIIAHSPKTTCSNTAIKHVKSSSGVEKLRMLHFLAVATFDFMKNEEPKELCAIIGRPKAATLEPINSFAQTEMFN